MLVIVTHYALTITHFSKACSAFVLGNILVVPSVAALAVQNCDKYFVVDHPAPTLSFRGMC